MKIAIVILNWNGRDLLKKFLPTVIQHSSHLATIYVADNASTDDSVLYVKQHFPDVQIIQNTENTGYAGGYNQALKHVKEELYILMNSDIETSQGWLEPIIKAFKENSQLGAAQPKILDYKDKQYFEYAGAAGGYIDALGYPYCRGRIFDTVEKDEGQYDKDATIFWASGACLCIRRDIYHQAQGLDPMFFAHQEEIDLCWRVQSLGYTIKYLAASSVYHVGGATLSVMNPAKTFYNFRNTLYVLVKNVPSYKVWIIIFIRLLLDGLAGMKYLIDGKPKHLLAILRAHTSFYSNLSSLFKRRRTIKKKNIRKPVQSIVFQYFVLSRKRYSQLP